MSSVDVNISSIGLIAFSAFGGIILGYDTGTISGVIAMKDWIRTMGHIDPEAPLGYSISSSTESLVVSTLSVGTVFGALLGAPVGDTFGRKWGIVTSCSFVCIGTAMQVASTTIPFFVTGRVFSGVGIGLLSCMVPMYQSECSPKWCRGAVISFYQWFITIGILLGAVINNATHVVDNHAAYRIPISVQLIWTTVLAGGMLLLPESPRWLTRQGRDAEALHSLCRIIGDPTNHDHPEVTAQLNEIRASLEQELGLGKSSYIDCFKQGRNKMAFRMVTGIFLQAFQQLSGINFIFYYNTTFFKNSGIQNNFIISIVISVVNVLVTLPGIVGIDRFGRRRLLLVGAAGMCFCHFIIAIVGVTVSVKNLDGQRVLVTFVCIFIGFFASTWACIAWVVVGEIFPLQVRAKAMSLCIASNWFWNFCIALASPYLVNNKPGSAGLGKKVFFIWGTTCLCSFVFAFFCIPETKGLSLEQIDLMYKHISPVNSHKYNKQLLSEGPGNVTMNGSNKDEENKNNPS